MTINHLSVLPSFFEIGGGDNGSRHQLRGDL